MTDLDRSPTPWSGTISLAAGATSVAASAVAVPTGGAVGLAGLPLLAYGVTRGSRRAVSWGAFVLFVGVLAAGVLGGSAGPLLVGGAAAILAWDAGEQAISLGEHVGRNADAARAELAHAGATVAVATIVAGTGYVVSELASGGQPAAGVALLLLAAVVIASAFRT